MNIYNEYLQKGRRKYKDTENRTIKILFLSIPLLPLKKKNKTQNVTVLMDCSVFSLKTSVFFVQKFERETRTAWNQNINYSCQWLLCRIGSKYYNKIFPYFHQNFPISGKGPTDTELLRDMSVLNNDVYSHHLRGRTVRKYAIFKIM